MTAEMTRRRFLAACLATGAAAYIPGIGLLDKHGTLDETVTTPPPGYTTAWEISSDQVEWDVIGYGETLTVPDLGLDAGLYWVRYSITHYGVTQDSDPTRVTVIPATTLGADA